MSMTFSRGLESSKCYGKNKSKADNEFNRPDNTWNDNDCCQNYKDEE